jgi:hypothetical protein
MIHSLRYRVQNDGFGTGPPGPFRFGFIGCYGIVISYLHAKSCIERRVMEHVSAFL